MSIRPVDLQVTVQKSVEANRAHNNEANRPEVQQQQQFVEKFQKEVQHNSQQVLDSNKSEGRNVDKEGKGNAGYSSSKKRKKREEDSKDKPKTRSDSMFDISI